MEDIKVQNELTKEFKIGQLYLEELNTEDGVPCTIINQSDGQALLGLSSNPVAVDLSKNFNYFRIFWFAPNKFKNYEQLQFAFKSCSVIRASKFSTVVDFFKNYSSIEKWIVIMSSSYREYIFSELHKYPFIKAFIIYCSHPEKYQHLIGKIHKLKNVVSEPMELFLALQKINEKYVINSFSYLKYYPNKIKIFTTTQEEINQNQGKSPIFAINSLKRELRDIKMDILHEGNKYSILLKKN